jgi:hypothetical protein
MSRPKEALALYQRAEIPFRQPADVRRLAITCKNLAIALCDLERCEAAETAF